MLTAFVGLLVVVALLMGVLRSIWKVTFGAATLVLPFGGSDLGTPVAGILAQQLREVEREWQVVSKQIRGQESADERESAERSDSPVLVDLPPSEPDQFLNPDHEGYLSEEPVDAMALGQIKIAGVTFSPESLFAAFHRLRAVLARRTIRGTVHQFDKTLRLAATLAWKRQRKPAKVVRRLDDSAQILEVIDDIALKLARLRLEIKFGEEIALEAETWGGYRAFLQGYAHHLRFLRTGSPFDRDRAIERYEESVAREPGYRLAHYNLGTLLYNRYTAADNRKTIEHLRNAAESPDQRLRALALAALALAYCQQVHRFGYQPDPWGYWAEEAGATAVNLGPNLEQTHCARGFAQQILERYEEALESYERTVNLPGETPEERRIKSFALNNSAYIHMTVYEDLDKAETLFRAALNAAPYNKMAHANLGEIYKRQERYEDALDEFDRALEIDPRYINATNETGMVYIALARSALARRKRRVASEFLRTARQWHERAVAMVHEGERRQRADLHRRFGEAFRQQGFADKARAEQSEYEELSSQAAGATSARDVPSDST
jgi:tetratricopeptide (TPR) repeat protein